jgi:hypothetical protein
MGTVPGMASKKMPITLDKAQLERIRILVDAGIAASVSGFVQHAVGVSLDDVAGWGQCSPRRCRNRRCALRERADLG